MKRDLDLCREILQRIEDGSELYVGLPRIEGRSEDEVRYQAIILSEADLLWSMRRCRQPEAEAFYAEGIKSGKYASTRDRYRLTWTGHEFLDAARDDTRWNRAKKIVAEKTGGLSFAVLQDLLLSLSRAAIGLA